MALLKNCLRETLDFFWSFINLVRFAQGDLSIEFLKFLISTGRGDISGLYNTYILTALAPKT